MNVNVNNSRSTWFFPLILRHVPFPRHIGVIMDGNRRYGREHVIPLSEAYQAGSQTLASMIEVYFTCGIETITVYAFAIANFQRSDEEINEVMTIIRDGCSRLLRLLQLESGGATECFGIKLRICGDKSLLPTKIRQDLEHFENILDRGNRVINICVAYGSRHEIACSIQAAIQKNDHRLSSASKGNISKDDTTSDSGIQSIPGLPSSRRLTEKALDDEMFTAGCPPMDLLVRTSGANRLSDFMLWQCHRDTHIMTLKANWPDLTFWGLLQVIVQWQLKISMSKFIESVKTSPSVFYTIISSFYMAFFLLLKTLNILSQYAHVIQNTLTYMLRDEEVSPKMIHDDTRKLKKLPTHLSIIVRLTDDVNSFDTAMSTVADIAIWCVTIGVPLLSVYEKTGKIKCNKDLVHRMVEIRLLRHYSGQRYHFNTFDSGISQRRTLENCAAPGFNLLLLSSQDGRESLANICNSLADSMMQGKLLPQEVDTAKIDRMLKAMLLPSLDEDSIAKASHQNGKEKLMNPIKDDMETLKERALSPDLLYVFGSSIQFDGYPPWQLATPEIFFTGEHKAVSSGYVCSTTYRIFLQGLYRYAGADIRLGR